MKDYYRTLGVAPSASTEEVRAAFRQLAKQLHPDMTGGSAEAFALVREAYDVLSEPTRRIVFDQAYQPPSAEGVRPPPAPFRNGRPRRERSVRPPPPPFRSRAAKASAQAEPAPRVTRIMSVAMPRDARLVIEGLLGSLVVERTRTHGLWPTTQRKFGTDEAWRLARHVVQVRVRGPRDLVRHLAPRPTAFGLIMQGLQSPRGRRDGTAAPRDVAGLWRPLTVHVTVPEGSSLFLGDVQGDIRLGDYDGELVASLEGGALRAEGLNRANLTLRGRSRASLRDVRGPVDVLAGNTSQVAIRGEVTRMRAVLEQGARADVYAPVERLMAELTHQSALQMWAPVQEAWCDVRDGAVAYLSEVDRPVQGQRSGAARVRVGRVGQAAPRQGVHL